MVHGRRGAEVSRQLACFMAHEKRIGRLTPLHERAAYGCRPHQLEVAHEARLDLHRRKRVYVETDNAAGLVGRCEYRLVHGKGRRRISKGRALGTHRDLSYKITGFEFVVGSIETQF